MRSLLTAALSAAFLVAGCHAQQNPSAGPAVPADVQKRVVEQLRQSFNVPPDVDISLGAEKPSDFPKYQKLPVTFSRTGRTTTVDFLLSDDQKTLVRLEKYDLSKIKLPEEVAKDFIAKEPQLTAHRPVRGDANAPVTIVNFDDFQCPFCSKMHQELFPALFDQYKGKVKIVYVDYPLIAIHPWALHAAVDANCLAAQNNDAYWDFADRVHSSQQSIGASHDAKTAETEVDKITREIAGNHKLDSPKLDACLAKNDKAAVEKSIATGDTLGVDSTPTLFVNGTKLEGAQPPEVVKQAIDNALKAAPAK